MLDLEIKSSAEYEEVDQSGEPNLTTQWRTDFLKNLTVDQDHGVALPEGISLEAYSRWLDNHITIEQVGDNKVIFCDYEHGDAQDQIDHESDTDEQKIITENHNRDRKILDHFAKKVVGNPKTKGVVREYFGPELKETARSSKLLKFHPGFKDQIFRRYVRQRLFGFSALNSAAAEHHKDIYTLDPANKPAYEAQYILAKQAAMVELLGLLFLGLIRATGPEILIPTLPVITYQFLTGHIDSMSEHLGINSYDSREMSWADKHVFSRYVLSHEDFRRVQTATLLEKLSTFLAEETGEILFPLPPAHRLRIIHYLQNPSMLKKVLYSMLPHMDRSIRQWHYGHDEKHQVNRWQLIKRF